MGGGYRFRAALDLGLFTRTLRTEINCESGLQRLCFSRAKSDFALHVIIS
jgi:hypothetical protein